MYSSRGTHLLCSILLSIALLPNKSNAESINNTSRSFKIDYNRNTFTKDGKDFRYVSGSFHYFRAVKEHWNDIFHKMRLAGLNAVQT
jgi:beta-galactosidase